VGGVAVTDGAHFSSALRRFSRESLLLFVALALLNGSNYLFHVLVSRLLGPSDYGALAALVAVVMVLSIPIGVVQTVVAERVASVRRSGADEVDAVAAATTKAVVPFAWAAGAVMLVLFSPALSSFLHIGFLSAALLAPYLALSIVVAVPLGVLQGRLRFTALAGVIFAGVAVRVGAGVGLVELGLGVPGAVLGTVLSSATMLVLGLRLMRIDSRAWLAAKRTLAHVRGQFACTLLGLTGFWLFAEVDVVLARHYLQGNEAGYYSSAGVLARSLLFLPAAVSVVAFPRFVAARQDRDTSARWLRLALAAPAVLVALALPVLIGLREPIVSLAFGQSYLPAAGPLPVLALAMAVLALVNVLVFFHIAMGSRAYLFTFAAIVVETIAIALFHGSGAEIAWVVFAVSAGLALVQYASAASLTRWRPPLERLGPAHVASGGTLSTPPAVELSLVLPCHNAAFGLRNVLHSLLRQLDQVGSYEIIVVSDGSTDETVSIARGINSDVVRILEYPKRGGKGHALQVGLTEARGEYIAFVDADGDIHTDAITSFLSLMKLYQPDIVLGSKRHPLSEVNYPPLRRLLSWTYQKVGRVLFRVNVRDTQTGAKLIRRDVLAAVLPRLLEKRYAFDLEFLVVARSLGYKRVFEAPVRIDYRFASQVRAHAVIRVLLDTLAIFYRHYILDTYRQAGEAGERRVVAGGRPASLRQADDHLRFLFINWRDIRNPEAGGAEVFTHEVTRRWVEQGHDVTLLTSKFDGARDVESIDGVSVRRIGKLRNGSFHLKVQRELARVRGFDLVVDEINTAPFLTPLWRRRLPPVVALIHQLAEDVLDSELPRPLAALGRWLEPRTLRLYRDLPVVTVSESTRSDLERIGLHDVSVVPEGRDEPPNLGPVAKEQDPTFLFVGRMAANKRPHHALRAFIHLQKLVPEARLWMVGHGPLEESLRKSLPPRAEMLGFVSRDELYRRLARAHCLLVPSVREGWGLVVIEANSVGTPAVGYDVPGLRDSIQHGRTGLLAAPGDSEALGRQAIGLVRDEETYAQMRTEAMSWAASFSWDSTASELMARLQDVLQSEETDLAAAAVAVSP
jgi:glycosyltransferase involved in cell wall biosynthesis/O-antigen/teichoic acid export membrane protein